MKQSLVELVSQLRDFAVNCGIEEDKFWMMTIPEANRAIQAWGWREKRHNQTTASYLYKLPNLIAIAVLDSKKYPEIYDIFPNEFDKAEIEESKRKYQIERDIAYLKAWAEDYNRRKELEVGRNITSKDSC